MRWTSDKLIVMFVKTEVLPCLKSSHWQYVWL